MQIVLDTKGLVLKKRNQSFLIEHREKNLKRSISPVKISSIAVTAACFLSTGAIQLAAEHQIPILFFDATGHARARLWSASFGRLATLRRCQVLRALDPRGTRDVLDWLWLKNQHQAELCRWLANRLPSQLPALLEAAEALTEPWPADWPTLPLDTIRPVLLGTEGSRARAYWEVLAEAVPLPWRFGGRSQHPARDGFNALLNYAYGMLYNKVEGAILSAGLDPHLGFMHTDAYNAPTLTYDLIEPFRPWVDELLLRLLMEERLPPEAVTMRADGSAWLVKEGKRVLIPAFNEWLHRDKVRFRGRDQCRADQIYRFVGEWAQLILDDQPPTPRP